MRASSADRNLKPRGFSALSVPVGVLLLLLLLAAGTARAHWPDVVFRNLTATPQGNDAYLLSVLAVNTEGETNANNVSFELGGPTKANRYCAQDLNLSAFEKRVVECRVQLSIPHRYVLAFQSQRITFDVGGLVPSASSPSPSPTPPPRSPGFETLGALGALAAALLLRQGRRGP